jgi:hypothetical protein
MNVLILDEGFTSGAFTAIGLARAGCRVDVQAAVGGRAECRTATGHWWFGPGPSEFAAPPGDWDIVYPATEPLQSAMGIEVRSKQCMSALARSAGVLTPEEHSVEADDDVRAATLAFGLPLVIKGSFGRGGKTTFLAPKLDAAVSAARRLRTEGAKPFAQRFIPGPTFLVGGLFQSGRALRIYSGRKTVQFPARTGPAAELVSVSDAGLLDAALRVFEAARVTGLASADFMRAPDGTWQFLELNPRAWGSISACRDAGVELFQPLAALWKGETVAPDLRFRDGVRSSVLPLAFLTSAAPRALWPALVSAADGMIEPRLALHIVHRLTRVARHW